MWSSPRDRGRLIALLLGLLSVLLGACGYPSYYPVDQTRLGGPLDGFIAGGDLPCTVLVGGPPVELTVFASAAVDLAIVTEQCEEVDLGPIAAGGSFSAPSNPGSVYSFRAPEGDLLGWFRVPDTGGQPWTEEVP